MLLSRCKLAPSDPSSWLGGMEGKRRPPSGSRFCHPGLVMLLLASSCLLAGFMAGRYYREGSEGPPGTATSRGVVGDASSSLSAITTKVLGKRGHGAAKPGKTVCTNTCAKANNGICDDGRANITIDPVRGRAASVFVLCDLGTDCADCGPWTPSVQPIWEVEKREGPIALLAGKQVEVRVKPTSAFIDNKSPFRFAYTDPKKDYDVSSNMQEHGAVEMSITKVFHAIFKNRCVKPDGSRSLFVDVGSNFGWFTIVAATMGCKVIAFEPVPHFKAFLEYNVFLNNLGHLVDIRGVVVSNQEGINMNMVVPSAGIWGTAGIDGLNIDKGVPGATETLSIPSVSLDGSVKEDVLLMKVDVEGWEWSVMQGAKGLLSKHNVENIVMEYSPGVAERNFRHNDSVHTVQMLNDIIGNGFRIAHILERAGLQERLEDPLPKYEEVLLKNLQYDMHDIMLVKENKLGCPLPAELRLCGGAIPEDLSPRSFRSVFGHNTNLWASKNRQLQQLEGHVGFIKLDEAPKTYTITKKHGEDLFGMGFRRCRDMEPQWQVRHRCPCANKAVCGAEEETVLRMANEDKIPTNYILP